MGEKCANCGIPTGGFWGKVAGLFGVKKSEKHPGWCNKCEERGSQPPVEPPMPTPPPIGQPPQA